MLFRELAATDLSPQAVRISSAEGHVEFTDAGDYNLSVLIPGTVAQITLILIISLPDSNSVKKH